MREDPTKADLERDESEGGERQVVPIPAKLHGAVTKGVLALADLLRASSAAEAAAERAFNAWVAVDLDDPSRNVKEAALDKEQGEANREYDRLQDPISNGITAVQKAVSAVEHFFIEADTYDDEQGRRQCAVEAFAPGAYSVVVSEVLDLDDIWNAEYTAIPYLQGRLGYTDEGATEAVKRIRHVSRETVLQGVGLDDALRVRDELTSLGCKAQVVEGRPRSTVQGRREPIPERVRHEVWRRDEGKCVDCGSRERLHFDHIVPVSKGGSNTARNIELRCEACNLKKGARI
jgi:5-methylcytosine-specific restriction endonuclease McrA